MLTAAQLLALLAILDVHKPVEPSLRAAVEVEWRRRRAIEEMPR